MPHEVLVVGGSGGIGAATCRALAHKGLRPIVGFSANGALASAVAADCGGRALFLDLTNDGTIASAIASLAAAQDPLLGVVLAASPPLEIGPFGQISVRAMRQQWQVNVEGPRLLLAGLVKSCLRKHKAGTVLGVLTKAMGADDSSAATGMGAYVIAKFGLKGLMAVLAAEYPWLTVRTISPGYTETTMLNAFDERFLDQLRKTHVFSTPDTVGREIAELMLPS
jgi:NAD(P)-dependent dehydrogenase (short-subunit alcohol dehydrogenase family)